MSRQKKRRLRFVLAVLGMIGKETIRCISLGLYPPRHTPVFKQLSAIGSSERSSYPGSRKPKQNEALRSRQYSTNMVPVILIQSVLNQDFLGFSPGPASSFLCPRL